MIQETEAKKVLDIIIKKGVAVGFIQLLLDNNCGGVREYNDYIGGNKHLHLTKEEFNLIAYVLINH